MSRKTCLDCKYNHCVDGMESCVWSSGLYANKTRCDGYKRSWGKTLSPILFILMILLLFIRIIIAGIYGV